MTLSNHIIPYHSISLYKLTVVTCSNYDGAAIYGNMDPINIPH